MINTIHILNGPNLNLLGRRQVDIYGHMPFEEYLNILKETFPQLVIEYYQSNHEGLLIDHLQQIGFNESTGIILNAGGLSHTSISLRDTIAAVPAPVIEVHISDIQHREPFRKHSYMTAVCEGHFIGHGLEGYKMAVEFLMKH